MEAAAKLVLAIILNTVCYRFDVVTRTHESAGGGSNALSLYELDPSAPIPSGAMSSIAASSTASSASPSASSASASLVRSTDTYEYSSCLSYTGSRPVSTRLSLSDPTVEKCHALCAAGNFQYCALEYGGECYGSNFLADNTSIQDVSRCGAMTCSGDKTQFCGAGSTSKPSLPLVAPRFAHLCLSPCLQEQDRWS